MVMLGRAPKLGVTRIDLANRTRKMAQQRYHVIERIDAGGMAEVFKANASSLQGFEKLVAIKRILPDLTRNERFVRMFLDEAKVSLHLNHTNCVQVFDLGLADGTYFIVMEFVDGTNLKNIIEMLKQRGETITVEESAYIALEICKGLAHAHNKRDQQHNHLGIVHRDISPPNVLISAEGEVKITDFGLAKAKSQVETTDPGIVKGKFGYLSPEAAHGEEVDARTDVFALGILMWEMLTGERLFLGNTDIETLQQVRRNSIPALAKYRRDVPQAFEAIIHKALATDVHHRYQTAEELARAISGFLYSYGKPVTSFDIARHVRTYRGVATPRMRTEKDKAVDAAIQAAVNRIVSLEEVEDLDLYLASNYEKFGGERAEGLAEYGSDASFEDPRLWADFGMEDVSVREAPVTEEEDWQERGLDELMRRRQTYPGGYPAMPAGAGEEEEDRTVEMNANVVAAIRPKGRPTGDVPLHQRSPGPQPGVAPQVPVASQASQAPQAPQAPQQSIAPQAPGPSVQVDSQMQTEFVPAGSRKASQTAEVQIASATSGSKKTGLFLILGILILVAILVLMGFFALKQ